MTALLEYSDPDCSIRVFQSFLAHKRGGGAWPLISTSYARESNSISVPYIFIHSFLQRIEGIRECHLGPSGLMFISLLFYKLIPS